MSDLGCPQCKRTPVVYYVSSRKWVCRSCGHSWDKEEKADEEKWDENWGASYAINPDMINLLKKMQQSAKTPATKSVKKSAAKSSKKPAAKKSTPAKAPKKKTVAKKSPVKKAGKIKSVKPKRK